MYQVTYYIDKFPYHYEFIFNSLWGAMFKARAIFEEHGIATDVMNTHTGEILATFEPNKVWTNNDLETDIQILAHKSLE